MSDGDLLVESTTAGGEQTSDTFPLREPESTAAPASEPTGDVDLDVDGNDPPKAEQPRGPDGKFLGEKTGQAEPVEAKSEHDPAKPPSKKDRIAYLTWEKHEERRQREAVAAEAAKERAEREKLAQEIQALRAQRQAPAPPPTPQAPPQAQDDDAPPTLEQFAEEADPYLAYVDARADWKARQVLKDERRRYEAAERERQQWAAVQTFESRRNDFASRTPDFAQVMQTSPAQSSGAMREAIVVSDRGPEILYFLCTHPEVADQLAAETAHFGPEHMPLVRRHLESLVQPATAPTAQSPAVKSNARPPIRPVGSSPVATLETDSDDDLNEIATYVRRQNKADAERLRRVR